MHRRLSRLSQMYTHTETEVPLLIHSESKHTLSAQDKWTWFKAFVLAIVLWVRTTGQTVQLTELKQSRTRTHVDKHLQICIGRQSEEIHFLPLIIIQCKTHTKNCVVQVYHVCTGRPQKQNLWCVQWITMIVLLQCRVLLWNLVSCHSCQCYMTHKTFTPTYGNGTRGTHKNCLQMNWGMWQRAWGVDPAPKFPQIPIRSSICGTHQTKSYPWRPDCEFGLGSDLSRHGHRTSGGVWHQGVGRLWDGASMEWT